MLLRFKISAILVLTLAVVASSISVAQALGYSPETTGVPEDAEWSGWFQTSDDSVVQYLGPDGTVLSASEAAAMSSVAAMALVGDGFSTGADALLDAYVIRIVASPSAERLRPYAELVARELSRSTGRHFSVAPGVIASSNRTAGYIDLVSNASTSPCGGWGNASGGTWGCGGYSAQFITNSMTRVTAGTVWVAPFAADGLSEANLTTLLLHEFGHSVSLDHYRDLYNGERQVMYPQISPSNHSSSYRNGDVNGLRYLAVPKGAAVQQSMSQADRLDPQNQAWIRALLHDMLGPERAAAVQNEWLAMANSGYTRVQMARFLATSQAWTEKVVTDLYREALGRSPDTGGAAYWGNQLALGVRPPAIAALVWGSPERVSVAGSAEAWVRQLYTGLLNRNADSSGLAFWVAEIKRVGFPRVASSFYQSQEKRLNRVGDQYRLFLGRNPDSAGAAYWANRVLQVGDLELTVELVNSEEYRMRAISRFGN